MGNNHGTLLLQGENPGNLTYFRQHIQWDAVVMDPGCGSQRLSACCMASGWGLLPSSLLSLQVLESYYCGSRHGDFIYSTQLFWGPWTSSYFKSGILDTCVLPLPLLSLQEWLDPNRRFQGSFACLSAFIYSFNPSCLLFAARCLISEFQFCALAASSIRVSLPAEF